MPRYAFAALSSQDFEELTRDLLQAEWNVTLEAFKSGRDSGIDLRYSPADRGSTIVQCKHYAASGFTKLLSHLRHSELPKVERLAPDRYVVVTSVGLTPANKEEIVQTLSPFVRSAADVFGAQDIEGLLSRHRSVERANFKLWLTSTSVLERVLHNAEPSQTEFEIDRVRRKLPLFVHNQAFPRAADLLDQTRIVIISGVPGIGKTTLAEMLLYAHPEQGYEPVVLKAAVAEGKRLFKAGTKQLFYYDDFLGQTFLGDRKEYLGTNEDTAILDFMEMIRQSAHGRFILTTREHILRNALQLSERIAHSSILDHRCVLELRDYSHGQKARILYNHLYFSNLSPAYKEAVLHDNFFLNVIKHPHFSPRLIEWLASQTRLRDVPPDEYRAHILQLLANPERIWSHAFRNQISWAARHVLVSLYTFGDGTTASNLEPGFISLHRHAAAKYQQPIAPGDFHRALQELDGAFLSYGSGHVYFLNPSIREFVAAVIADGRETCADLLFSAVRFKQLVKLWELSQARQASELHAFLRDNMNLFVESLSRLLDGPARRSETMRDGSRRDYYIDVGEEGRIRFLVEVAESRKSSHMAALANKGANSLVASWKHIVPSFGTVVDLLVRIQGANWFLAHAGRDVYRGLLDSLLNELAFAQADDWLKILDFSNNALEWTEADEQRLSQALTQYIVTGVKDERAECTTLGDLSELKESLEELTKEFGLDFARVIDRLDEDIAEREDSRDDYREGGGYGRRGAPNHHESISDEDIAQMFGTLLEGN